MPRSYCLVLSAVLFLVSQVVASSIRNVAHMWIASALLGLAYGSVFSLSPTVCLEWFGMRKCLPRSFQRLNVNFYIHLTTAHFSENWGYLCLSPIVAGNLFSIVFGRNLDAHDGSHTSNAPLADGYSAPQCLQGLNCYVDTIYLTMLATFLCVLLSIWAGYRDRVKIATSRKILSSSRIELNGLDEEVGQCQ